MNLGFLTRALVEVSEKAAVTARAIRSEQALFELLVEEKTGEARNKRFVQDFKTLADVLVQETVRHDVAKKFPGLGDHIYGEESNTFTNTQGESVTVSIQPTCQETSQLLTKVLDGNVKAADILAQVIHSDVTVTAYPELNDVNEEVAVDDVGIWIDPIDSTAQYIHGYEQGQVVDQIHVEGLQCVVVIIGAYQRSTGIPIVGVCNQPFHHCDSDSNGWQGRSMWGISHKSTNLSHVPDTIVQESTVAEPSGQRAVVMSSSEVAGVQERLVTRGGFQVRHAAGAGYKALCVVDGRASAYVLSVGSTFKWDTCGPHAILRARGGEMLNLKMAGEQLRVLGDGADREALSSCCLKYSEPETGDRPAGEKWANAGGIIAYMDDQDLLDILRAIG